MSELVWIAVPGGLASGGTALVRIMVVPRLAAGTLADFDLTDWPDTLRTTSFLLDVKSGDQIWTAQTAPTYRPLARSEVWRAFFGGEAGNIEQWRQPSQPTPQVGRSYPDASRVAGAYRRASVDVIRPAAQPEQVVRREIERWDVPAAAPAAPPVEQPLAPLPVPPDFHRAVAMLREHPAVLRDLGLIIELTVRVADLSVGDPAARQLRVRPAGSLSSLVRSPWTAYELAGGEFWPATAAGARMRMRNGMLDLEGAGPVPPAPPTGADEQPEPSWAVTTVDVDGAVRSLRDAARALRAGGPDRPAMPGVRSAGLLLLRPRRQDDFDHRLNAAAGRARTSPESAELTAEDLILGYRVDIRTGDGPWRSLCERLASYRVRDPADGGRILLGGDGWFPEEGHVKPFPAVRTPDGSLHADEVVVRWDGWSLALPPVDLLGRTAGPDRTGRMDLPYEFEWDYRIPPGRLPKLRYATRYQMRVRLVDIAGGGPELATDGVGASDTILYTRHDPVPPPVLDGGGGPAPGAAVDRLVIRSDHGVSVTELHAAHPGYPDFEQRRIEPPLAPFVLVEQHGMFDPPASDAQTWRWARRALTAEPGEDVLPDPAASGINAYLPVQPGVAAQRGERAGWPAWPEVASKLIVLSEAADSDPPISFRWEADGTRLNVRLAKAQQVTIELSSTIRDGYLDHFPLFAWLTEDLGTPQERRLATLATLEGRNPVLSPVRRVHLVHAVRKPLTEPRWLPPQVNRSEGGTTAVLDAAFTGDGLDTDSTGGLEVAASWQEWSDTGVTPVAADHLHSQAIDRSATPTLRFRHEFGDTRHRRITYTLTAVSRFRHDFDPDEPASAFQVRREQGEVIIPATARPPAPTVLATAPAFRWRTQLTETRIVRVRTTRLRVELARPWFQTGADEQLAVIVAAEEPPAAPVTEHLTQLGRDPVLAAPAVPTYPTAAWFAGFAGDIARELPAGLDHQVAVLPYPVTDAGDRWYADIDVSPAARSYAPFVRLAVARFQRHSLANLSLSPIVRADDTVRLLPERQLVVEPDGAALRVSLLGAGPHPRNRVEAVLESIDLPPGTAPDVTDLIDVNGGADLPAWRVVPGHRAVGDQHATLIVPLPATAGPLRLRVRESERLDTVADPSLPPELRERTVFIDMVAIPPGWRPA
ncbi:hypothetical protein [Micromonospora sp. NPDC051296]|uniref:hypothetical protein n=1 Tax=Micromonospora sp. NPDC051296 TaxID=3155046 RepID=UPI003441516A